MKMRWLGGVETPVTAQHFLTYRDEGTSVADGTYWISRIPRPILIIARRGRWSCAAVRAVHAAQRRSSGGFIVPSIKYVLLPNHRRPSREGHQFADNEEELIDAVLAWLAEREL